MLTSKPGTNHDATCDWTNGRPLDPSASFQHVACQPQSPFACRCVIRATEWGTQCRRDANECGEYECYTTELSMNLGRPQDALVFQKVSAQRTHGSYRVVSQKVFTYEHELCLDSEKIMCVCRGSASGSTRVQVQDASLVFEVAPDCPGVYSVQLARGVISHPLTTTSPPIVTTTTLPGEAHFQPATNNSNQPVTKNHKWCANKRRGTDPTRRNRWRHTRNQPRQVVQRPPQEPGPTNQLVVADMQPCLTSGATKQHKNRNK